MYAGINPAVKCLPARWAALAVEKRDRLAKVMVSFVPGVSASLRPVIIGASRGAATTAAMRTPRGAALYQRAHGALDRRYRL
jgi:hypothetical protein